MSPGMVRNSASHEVELTSQVLESPAVSVIVPCRNEAMFLPRLLVALANQDYGGRLEVIVVDGGSVDRSDDLVRATAASPVWRGRLKCLRLVCNPSQSIPVAMNLGVATASHDVIVRIDAHATVPSDYVRKLVEVLTAGDLDVVGPRKQFVPPEETLTARCIARAVSSRIARGKTEQGKGPNQIRYVTHAGLSCYYASTFRSVGGFDERLEANEDFDFDYRCRVAGFRIGLLTDVVFYSFSRATYGELFRQRIRYGYWRLRSLVNQPASI